ncbi:hypothetical protein XBFFL1_1170003 [Xenorhabdus bovienii str. feltiae Florida]|nr:hypothetical protein XBFFR1_1850001 [Xenorhabdus bovienii str. feltiae France]CDG90901.1 hypothetical protein XBFFL1_1170003 [Xenorhabdus bovienii str. feltiae Florida]
MQLMQNEQICLKTFPPPSLGLYKNTVYINLTQKRITNLY